MFDYIEKHFVSFTFSLCLLLCLATSTFFNSSPLDEYSSSYFIITIFFIFAAESFVSRIKLCSLSLFLFINLFIIDAPTFLFLIAEYILLLCFTWMNRHKHNIYIFSIIIAAFLLHLNYILNTTTDIRQHDLSGVILYMNEITRNGFNFWEFNPWYMYYLFHQPLHFLVAGYLFKIGLYWGLPSSLSLENLQYLSLFYVTLTSVIAAIILQKFTIEKTSFYAGLLLFCFNPTLSLFSGYISDDVPTIFWSVSSIYFAFQWYQKEKIQYIVLLALGFSFGVLTKLSTLMLVPSLSFLFAHKLLISAHRKDTLQQLCYFILIAVPIALFWIIRNHLLFDMQFYNIPDTSPAGQNFKYLTLLERIGDLSMISVPFINAPTISDTNIFLAIIKTELFGEWDLSILHRVIYFPALGIYILNILLKILALISCMISLKSAMKKPLLGFFCLLYLTLWGYSLKYTVDYPYICSANFRLFAQLILPEVILLAHIFDLYKKSTVLFALTILYTVLSCFIYVFGI
ncbi:MAG: hypothetical protein NC218_04850 [Acetobacter sp.]|nr:hypothetical protein [Acetobacter sp.]